MLVFFSLIEILALKVYSIPKRCSALSCLLICLLICISCHLSVQFSEVRGFNFATHCCRKKPNNLLVFLSLTLDKGETAICSTRTDVRAEEVLLFVADFLQINCEIPRIIMDD